jgi:predicted RNase H-like HicB family nuclease
MKANLKLTAVFEEQKEGGYIGFVEEISGVNTQGETLDETRSNLIEALLLVLETQREIIEESLKGKNVIRENIRVA